MSEKDSIPHPSQKQTLIDTVRELESIPDGVKRVYDLLHNADSKTKVFAVADAEAYADLVKHGFFTEVEDPEPIYKDWQLLSLYESSGGVFPEKVQTYTQKKKWCVEHPLDVCEALYPRAAIWYAPDGAAKVVRANSAGLKPTSRITFCRSNLYMYLSCRMRDEGAGYYDSSGIWDSASPAVLQLLSEYDPSLPLPSKRKLRIVRRGVVGEKEVYEEYDFELGWVTDEGYESECRRLCEEMDIPFDSPRTQVGNAQITYYIDPVTYRPPYEMPHIISYYEDRPAPLHSRSPSVQRESDISQPSRKTVPRGDEKTITMTEQVAKSDFPEGCAFVGLGILGIIIGFIIMFSSATMVLVGLIFMIAGITFSILPFIEKKTGNMSGQCPACNQEIVRYIRKDQKTLQCPHCAKRLTIRIIHQ